MSPRRAVLFVLLALALYGAVPRERAAGGSPGPPLLGPFAHLAVRVQLVRSHAAVRRGQHGRALARLGHALAWDPGSTRAWQASVRHQAFFLASPEREPDPARRAAWLRSAIETARRGEARARDPAALAELAGIVLASKLELDPELAWPGGPQALAAEARAAFERARDLRELDSGS